MVGRRGTHVLKRSLLSRSSFRTILDFGFERAVDFVVELELGVVVELVSSVAAVAVVAVVAVDQY